VTYLLDANVFIEAKNRHYAFDLCPGSWTWLDEAHASNRVHSVAKIGEELRARDDELATWARERTPLFLRPGEAVVESLRELSIWAPVPTTKKAPSMHSSRLGTHSSLPTLERMISQW